MEEGTPEASLADVAMGQASVSTSPTPSTAGRSAPKELLPQEGLAPLEIGTEPSWSLVQVVALDDVAEEREWGSVHTEVGTAVHALTTVLSSMRDIFAPVGQV